MARKLVLVALLCFLITSAAADSVVRFRLPSGVAVRLVEAAFDVSKFNVAGCDEKGPICRVNGRPAFGTDLSLPRTYLKNLRVSFKNQNYLLDTSQMFNAWGDRHLI